MDSPAPEPRPCPSCGADNAAGRNFCRACGARLSPPAFAAGLLLWPAPRGERGDEAALDRANRKYLALAQALAAGQSASRSFTEAEGNAFLAANTRDGKNRPRALSVRLHEEGFSLVLPARLPFGASKCWSFVLARPGEPGGPAARLTSFSLGHLPVFLPLAQKTFRERTWPAWREESREVVDFFRALDVATDGKTLVLSTR